MFQIITFYKFKAFDADELVGIRDDLRSLMRQLEIKGTIILAKEGFNSTLCGRPEDITVFLAEASRILDTEIEYKSSFHDRFPFRRVDVKIKPEIVTLKKSVDISRGAGTHISARDWNRLIKDPEITLID